MTPQQLEIFRRYFDSGMLGESTKAEQEQILNANFGGDFNAYADWWANWWLGETAKNPDLLDQYPATVDVLGQLADAGYEPAQKTLTSAGYENTPETSAVPIEQGILQNVLPRLNADIDADAGRAALADNLAQSAITGTAAATDQLARTQGGGFDSVDYYNRYPGILNEVFAGLNDGTKPGTKAVPTPNGVVEMTPQEFAEFHYINFGQREGLQARYVPSAQLAQDFNNADRITQANIAASNQAFQTQLTGLQAATTAMQQNLTGNLADRAAALQQQITALNQNLDRLDATQRKALVDQIAEQQANLEQAVGAQRAALEQQLATLGTAASTEAQARKAALEAEIAGLTAAQAPLAAARLQAGELQATAVNVGLERTRDQLTADAARDGFVGGSTFQDAALARATIDARQRAAQAISGARVQNASDTRDIGVRGATGQRSIADALAGANREIATLGAGERYSIDTNFAKSRQSLADTGAIGKAAITNQTAQSRAGIGAMGANQTFQDQVFGADQKRSLSDTLARGTFDLTSANAGRVLDANRAGNAAKATYYDNDFGRRLSSSLGLASLPATLTNTLTGLDNYANSGLGRTLGTLSWWSTNQAAAPTPGFTAVQPSTVGNSISNLGAGLASAGIQAGIGIGNANQWWQTPRTPAPTTPGGINAGGAATYTNPIT